MFAANEAAASRQELARRLGVSTHTIQRILVEGEVPRFPEERNPRITRSWARTLTRIALVLGHDAREWILAVGLAEADATVTGGPTRSARAGRTARESGALPAVIHVGLATPGLFDGPLVELWLGALDPAPRIETDRMPGEGLWSALSRDVRPIHLGLGAWHTAWPLQGSSSWIRLPGWRVALGGICVSATRTSSPTWEEIAASASTGDLRFAVHENHPARHFLLGALRVDRSRLTGPPASILDLEEDTVFVSDEFTCRQRLQSHASPSAEPGPRCAFRVADPEGQAPADPIGLAVAPNLRDWTPALREALDVRLFGAWSAQMAEIYATSLAREIRPAILADPFATAIDRGPIWLEDFSEASDRFIEHFSRRLLDQVAEMIRGHVGTGAQRHWARVLAARLATSVLPSRWRSFLQTALDGTRPETDPHCNSCSASLLDPDHQGISEHYCRYCATEDGRLRDRDEIRRLLTGWFAHWPGGVPEPEASRRARSFMAAMPAWQCN